MYSTIQSFNAFKHPPARVRKLSNIQTRKPPNIPNIQHCKQLNIHSIQAFNHSAHSRIQTIRHANRQVFKHSNIQNSQSFTQSDLQTFNTFEHSNHQWFKHSNIPCSSSNGRRMSVLRARKQEAKKKKRKPMTTKQYRQSPKTMTVVRIAVRLQSQKIVTVGIRFDFVVTLYVWFLITYLVFWFFTSPVDLKNGSCSEC